LLLSPPTSKPMIPTQSRVHHVTGKTPSALEPSHVISFSIFGII
jgi:hypothetical protein